MYQDNDFSTNLQAKQWVIWKAECPQVSIPDNFITSILLSQVSAYTPNAYVSAAFSAVLTFSVVFFLLTCCGSAGKMRLRTNTLIDAPNAFEDLKGTSTSFLDSPSNGDFMAVNENMGPEEPKSVTKKPYIVAGLACMCLVFFSLVEDVPGFHGKAEARRCLGLLLFVAIMWAGNPIPAHVTALTVPFLTVILRVIRIPATSDAGSLIPYSLHNRTEHPPGTPIEASQAASIIAGSMFDPVIFLFLGGFAIAAALDKYQLSGRIAAALLSRAGTRPSRILLALLFMGVIFSGFMSNVAATVNSSSIRSSQPFTITPTLNLNLNLNLILTLLGGPHPFDHHTPREEATTGLRLGEASSPGGRV